MRSKAPAVLGVLASLVAIWGAGTLALIAVAPTPAMPESASHRGRGYAARVAAGRTSARVAPLGLTPFPRSSDDLRAIHADAERLPLDARLVAAFADVQRVRGATVPAATARFERDHWVVSVGAAVVGELPLLATPADALPLLARSTGASPASGVDLASPNYASEVTAGSALAALRALATTPSAPGAPPPHPAAAARALAALLHETPDRAEGTDALAARALAAAAWARALGAPAPDAEALVAFAMGYPRAAVALAAGLSPDDPVRAYVNRDDARLAATARPASAYLRFRRAVARRDPTAADLVAALLPSEAGTAGVAGFLPAAMAGRELGERGRAARAAPSQVVAALQREAGVAASARPVDDAAVLARAADLLARPVAAAPWVDAGVYGAHVRAATATALMYGVDFDLVARSDTGGAAERVAGYGDGGPLRPLVAWLGDLVRGEQGDVRGLVDRALGDDALPGALRLRGLDTAGPWVDRAALVRVVAHLDSRPSHRAGLLHAVAAERLDPTWHRALCRASLAEHVTDSDDLDECRARDARPPGTSAPLPETTAAAEARFAAADARGTHWMDSRSEHAKWLIAQNRAPEAEALARSWLASHDDPTSLEPAFIRTGLARALLAQDRPDDAWAAIEPALATWQGGAMEMGVRVLVARGRLDEALVLARRRLDRYPGVMQAARVAEVLWRQSKVDEAAQVLAGFAPRGERTEWRTEVGEALARAYATEPPAAAGAASAALVRRNLDPGALEALAKALDEGGHPAHALAFDEALTAPGLRGLSLLPLRYRLHVHAGSRAEADRWLATAATPATLGPVAMFAFAAGDDELTWTAADAAAEGGEHEANLWLLRTGAWLRSAPDPARRARIEAALAAPTHPYHHMARYLLGLEPLDAMLALADADDRRSEVAYWVGFRAHCEGRLEEAADWYRFDARRGLEREGEVAWSMVPLRMWSGAPVWLDAFVDPWASAHAGAAPVAVAPSAVATPETPPEERRSRRHQHAPGGHHGHHGHHHRGRTAEGARS